MLPSSSHHLLLCSHHIVKIIVMFFKVFNLEMDLLNPVTVGPWYQLYFLNFIFSRAIICYIHSSCLFMLLIICCIIFYFNIYWYIKNCVLSHCTITEPNWQNFPQQFDKYNVVECVHLLPRLTCPLFVVKQFSWFSSWK